MASPWVGGSTSAWRKLRASVLLRDQHRCQLRSSPRCEGTATHVHHKLGIKVSGLMADPSQLEAACRTCNLHTGEPSAQEAEPTVDLPDWMNDL